MAWGYFPILKLERNINKKLIQIFILLNYLKEKFNLNLENIRDSFYIKKNMNNLKEKYTGKKIDHMDILNIEDAAKISVGKKSIIVTGVTGQDGSHMVDYLLANTDYEIFGCVRRLSVYNHKNISHINSKRFHLINFDLIDSHSIARIIEKIKPDYFINLAAQSFVGSSWDFAHQTWETNSTSTLHILEAIRLYHPTCRFYQAGSSEEFGDVAYAPQDENHPLRPRSPYGASKAASRQLVKVWRESYGLYAVQGWLFNHEGTRRGEEFVTRKITKNIARIKNAIDRQESFAPLELGNLDALRDWSDAEDFVDGIWKMLNQEKYWPSAISSIIPLGQEYREIKEYVLSSNETHSIREFVELAFEAAGIQGSWFGEDLQEEFRQNETGRVLLVINSKFYRPAEVELLLGDSSKARQELNWSPKSSFEDLVKKMLANDLNEYRLEHGEV
jgi:GDPmannose 4,6-dehydratase